MKIRPLHDWILVARLEAQEVGRGGIIIPDTAKEKPQEGKVVAVGRGKVNEDGKRIPLDVQTGDRKEIELKDAFENMGAQMLKEVAVKRGPTRWRCSAALTRPSTPW